MTEPFPQNPLASFPNVASLGASAKIDNNIASTSDFNILKNNISSEQETEASLIMKRLIENVQRMDFGEIKTPALLVKICDALKDVSQKIGVHLSSNELGNFIYNEKQWVSIPDGELTQFLLRVAEKMGVSGTTARQFKNLENLIKQFAISFYEPRRNRRKSLINLQNGTFDFSSEKIYAHNPKDGFNYTLPFDYDPKAACPMFMRYLSEVLPEKSAQAVLCEYMGYIFLDLKLERVMLLYGSGANGKSVFIDVISALLGKQNITNYSLSSLSSPDGRYIPAIASSLLNVCSDVSTVIGDPGIFKLMVSGEALAGRELYKKPVTISSYARLLFSCNELPATMDYSAGYFRRLLIVPFSVEIQKEKQDKTLASKIAAKELSGVLNWILDGMRRLIKTQEFTDSESILRQISEYRMTCDNVSMFMDENNYTKSESGKTALAELYRDYDIYCYQSGNNKVSKVKFSERVRKIGYRVYKGNGNATFVSAVKNVS